MLPPIEQISYDDGSGGYQRSCSAAAAFTWAFISPGCTTAVRVTGSTSMRGHPLGRDHQAALDRRRAAGQPAAGAAGHHGDAVRGREPHRRLHVLGRPGPHHRQRDARVGVVGAVPAVLVHPLRIGDDHVLTELRDQRPEVDLHCSRHVGKTDSLMAKTPTSAQRGVIVGDRVTVGGLQVASVLHAFVRDEALPGSGVDEAAFWSRRRGDPGRLRPAQPRAAGPPRRAPAAARRVAREEPGPGRRPGGVRPAAPRPRLPRRRARRLHHRDQRRRRGGRRPGRPAARRTGAQRAVRRQRRQRPLGLALRRALRHRRAARGRRPGARGRRRTTRSAARP